MKNGYCHSSSKKYAKMILFGLKTHFKKNSLGYFYPPTLPMQKNWVKMVPKQVFTRAGIKSPPPTRCPFLRPLLVGLKSFSHRVEVKCCVCSLLNYRVAWVLGSIGVSSLNLLLVHLTKNIIGGSGDSLPFYS